MSDRALDEPLSDAELDELEAFLSSDAVPQDCMDLEMLDGYLCAIVSGPEVIQPSEWLPGVWSEGGRAATPAYTSTEQAQHVMAQALADSMLLHISKQTVFDELAREPEFAKKMLAGLSRRLHSLVSDVESYSLQSGTQRVIGYLLRQDDGQGAGEGPAKLTLPVAKAVVASRLNLTPEHFSRILHELQSHDLIRVDGRDVHLVDVARLRAYEG